LEILAILATVAVAIVVIPLIMVCMVGLVVILGYFVGWLLTLTPFAAWVITGAAALGISVTIEQLPYISASLAFVGVFFKVGPKPSHRVEQVVKTNE
jgi:hypothetical protein